MLIKTSCASVLVCISGCHRKFSTLKTSVWTSLIIHRNKYPHRKNHSRFVRLGLLAFLVAFHDFHRPVRCLLTSNGSSLES